MSQLDRTRLFKPKGPVVAASGRPAAFKLTKDRGFSSLRSPDRLEISSGPTPQQP
jgi:hypothetical protein